MNKQVQAIRAYVERKIKMMERNIASLGDGGASISIATYQDVLNILDTLPEEKPSKDLVEAAKASAKAWHKNPDGSESKEVFEKPYIRGFLAGAKLQKQQMPMPEDTVLFQQGVAEGKRLMMEDAIEGQIYGSDGSHWIESEIDENLKGKEGDKVRIVVLKAE